MFGGIDSIPQRSPDYERDNEMSYIDSFEHNLSSSGKVRFSESFCVCFISLFLFSLISFALCCSKSDGFYLFFLKYNVPHGRKRHLDDALFEFFRKEVVSDNYFSRIRKDFSLIHLYLFFAFFARALRLFALVLFLGCKIAQG